MKKFAKNCLITAGIMFAIGILICGICFAIGGKEIFTNSTTTLPYFLGKDNTLDINIGGNKFSAGHSDDVNRITSYSQGFYKDYPIYEKEHTNNQVCKATEIENLDFQIIGGTTNIKPSNTDYFQISYEGTGKVQYFVSDSTLHIIGFYEKEDAMKIKKNFNDELTLYIPSSVDISNCNFDIDAGELNAKNVVSDTINLDFGAGDVFMQQIDTDCFTGNVGAGCLDIQNGNISDFSIDVGMGTLSYNGIISGDLIAKCGMGSIDFSLEDSQKNHNFNFECAMGSIELNGHDYSGFAFDNSIDNDVDSTYDFECAMGSICVNFKK